MAVFLALLTMLSIIMAPSRVASVPHVFAARWICWVIVASVILPAVATRFGAAAFAADPISGGGAIAAVELADARSGWLATPVA